MSTPNKYQPTTNTAREPVMCIALYGPSVDHITRLAVAVYDASGVMVAGPTNYTNGDVLVRDFSPIAETHGAKNVRVSYIGPDECRCNECVHPINE
jgi:hypothetical protein